MTATEGRARKVLEPPSRSTPLRAVIADHHAVYREGLAHTLRQSGIEVIDTVPSAEAALQVVEETAPDVAILDLDLPGISGPEAIRRLRRRAPGTPVIVIGVSATEAGIINAIVAGASGYLEKHRPVEEIIGSIRGVAAGEPGIPARIATALLRHIRDRQETEVEPHREPLDRARGPFERR